MRVSALVLSLLAGLTAAGAAPSQAAILTERFTGDAAFTNRCGGSDGFNCEYAVAEGRAGNRAKDGNGEKQIFDRVTDGSTSSQYESGDFATENPFSLTYDGSGELRLRYLGSSNSITRNLATPPGGSNPTGVAQSIFVRVRDADLSDLRINGTLIDDGKVDGIPGKVSYLAFAGVDLTKAWAVTGKALLGSGTNSGSAFQLKITDLVVTPVPPAALLFASAVGLLGVARRRRQRAA